MGKIDPMDDWVPLKKVFDVIVAGFGKNLSVIVNLPNRKAVCNNSKML